MDAGGSKKIAPNKSIHPPVGHETAVRVHDAVSMRSYGKHFKICMLSGHSVSKFPLYHSCVQNVSRQNEFASLPT